MKRRDFITLLGGAAAAGRSRRARSRRRELPTIGVLAGGTPSSHGQRVAALVQRFRELGWTEGRTVAVEVRWAEGRSERFAEIAAEFVRLKVDVIFTSGPAVPAVRQATSAIPIVFAGAGEPVATGLVASLARPGGNVTGLSTAADRSCGQEARAFSRGCPAATPPGDHRQRRRSGRDAGDERGSGGGRVARPRDRHCGNPAGRGYRAYLRGRSRGARTPFTSFPIRW